MSADDRRIRLESNGEDYPWPWTAYYEIRGRDGWVEVEREDGDTWKEAQIALQDRCFAARLACPVVPAETPERQTDAPAHQEGSNDGHA